MDIYFSSPGAANTAFYWVIFLGAAGSIIIAVAEIKVRKRKVQGYFLSFLFFIFIAAAGFESNSGYFYRIQVGKDEARVYFELPERNLIFPVKDLKVSYRIEGKSGGCRVVLNQGNQEFYSSEVFTAECSAFSASVAKKIKS